MTTDQLVPLLLSMLDGVEAIRSKPIETIKFTDGLGTALKFSIGIAIGALLGQIFLRAKRSETAIVTMVVWFISLMFVWGGHQMLFAFNPFDERRHEIRVAQADVSARFESLGGCDSVLGDIRSGEIETLDGRIEDFLLSNCGTRAVEQAGAAPGSQFRWQYRPGA